MFNRLTDLCEYCEKETKLKKQIAKFIHTEKYVVAETFNVVQFREKVYSKALNLKHQLENQNLSQAERLSLDNKINDYKSMDDNLRDYEVVLKLFLIEFQFIFTLFCVLSKGVDFSQKCCLLPKSGLQSAT